MRLILLFLLSFPAIGAAQTSVHGRVSNAITKEAIPNASIWQKGDRYPKTRTDANGLFTLEATHSIIVVSADGFHDDTVELREQTDSLLKIFLSPIGKDLDAIEVNAENRNSSRRELAGVQHINAKDLKNIPVLFGERDILKTIQLMPGIKNAGEGTSGLYVRGGSADQNLILMDGATVYNASHLLGFFSIFNSDIIGKIGIYKGAMPSELGGRLSSVIDVNVNAGNTKTFSGSGGIGLIASRLNLEGPIFKDRASFLLAARRTYPDAYLRFSRDIAVKNNKLNFDDLNAKLFFKLNRKNDLSITAYQGKDRFSLGNYFGLEYGNKLASIQWTRRANERSTARTSASFTHYAYDVAVYSSNTQINNIAYIRDLTIRHDRERKLSENSTLKYGGYISLHDLKPNAIIAQNSSSYNSVEPENRRAAEFNAYISHELRYRKKYFFNYGLRVNAFSVLGPGNYYVYDSAGNLVDVLFYPPWNIGVPYVNIEPRFSVNYDMNEDQSLKFAYARNSQNLHLLSTTTSASPIDIFFYSNNNIKPETSDQVSAGYFRSLFHKDYELVAEIYYKSLHRQLEFKNGAQVIANDYIEPQLVHGKGRAYGLELMLRKKTGNLTGWLAYTLSKTQRKFVDINNGNWFNARQDRPHEISLVGIYQLNRKWLLSSTWVFYSGNAVTFPNGKYDVAGQTVFYYSERNAQRMPNYHRLDLAATRKLKTRGKYESSWTFSVYNAYNRDNAYSINFEEDPDDPNKTIAIQTTLFRIVPSITYNFKF